MRGAAVAAVVAFHLGFTSGGYLGVDLFFTLSGFLITGLLVAEWRARGRIDLKTFWVRRARRLLPALLLVLAAVALATREWASRTTFDSVRHDSIAALAYVANWRSVAAGTDYWNLFARPSPLEHMWSLAIEEQFYLVWPLVSAAILVWVTRRRRRAAPADEAASALEAAPSEDEVRHRLDRYLAIAVGLAVVSAVVALVRYGNADDANRVYFGTDTRAAAICFGAALAIAAARFGHVRGRRARIALEATAVVSAVVLGWAWLNLRGTDDRLYQGGLLVCGLLAVVILAAASHPTPGPVARVLSFPPLRWLGLISYGLYLWHWPVITFLTPGRTGLHDEALVAARLSASLGLAVVSYLLVEQPIRHGAGTGWPIRLATPVAVVAVLVVVGWSTQHGVTPFGDRGGGRNALRVADTPIPPVDPDRQRVLVVGDSGAWAIRGPMAEAARSRRLDVINRGTPACGVLPGNGASRYQDGRTLDDPPGCDDWPTRWADHVDEAEPDTALIVSVAPAGAERFVDGRWRKDCDPVFDEAFQQRYQEAIRTLAADGATVGVTTIAYQDSASDADGRFPEVDCRNRSIERAAGEAGATVIDLASWVCDDDDRCRDTVEALDGEEVELRPDGLHYSGAGGIAAARYILDTVGVTAR